MAQTHLPPNWEQRVHAGINGHGWLTGQFPAEALRLYAAWAKAEGGLAQWNPLNTTYPLPNSTMYNSSNVRNYSRPTEGVCATVLTLVNGFYPGILGDLQGGQKTAVEIVNDNADEFRTWGTNPDTILAVLAV
jgi:hypothetical protein